MTVKEIKELLNDYYSLYCNKADETEIQRKNLMSMKYVFADIGDLESFLYLKDEIDERKKEYKAYTYILRDIINVIAERELHG